MTNPETLVKGFIEDYYLWNNKAFELAEKLRADELSALTKAGITEPFRPNQSDKVSQYVEIKGKYSAGMMNLFAHVEAEYQKIIDKYCRPNWKHLNTAFGGDSSHNPNNEIIVAVKTENHKCIVKTEKTKNPIPN